jgi:hypothetical protein
MSEPTVGYWLDDRWTVIAHCEARGCSHSAELDLPAIAASHGRSLTSSALRRLLRCRRCQQLGGALSVEPNSRQYAGEG